MIERTGGHLHVTVPMTLTNANGLLEAGRDAFRGKREVIDLGAVREADSSALAVLMGWLRVAKSAGCSLLVINAPANLRALASLYGVDEVLDLP